MRPRNPMRHIGIGVGKPCRAHRTKIECRPDRARICLAPGRFSMADNFLLFHGTAVHAGARPQGPAHRPGQGRRPCSAGPLLPHRPLPGGRRRRLAHHPLRSGPLHLPGQGHLSQRRATRPLSRRRVHAAHRAATCSTSRSSTSPAARWSASTTSPWASQHDGVRDILYVLEVDIGVRSISAGCFQGVLPPTVDPPPAAAAFRPTPSAGSSATSSSPIRSAACA